MVSVGDTTMMGRTALILVAYLLQFAHGQDNDVTVTTEVGTFIGFTEEIDVHGRNATITKFLGIPYAEPPTGDNRFRKPVAKKPLSEPLKVQEFGGACLQNYFFSFRAHDTDSEDCLFLNIFKPSTDSDERVPVMVWIHGGAFVLGSADAYIGDSLAASGPVLVVTINYRLSVWGFLSTQDDNAPGNYGLWDQHLAIQWVHKNIANFGGDPDRVTIFGESAGAASVIYQGLYPGNKRLFQRIIAQSGTASGYWAIKTNPKADTKKLAALMGCESGEVKAMVECLRQIPASKINNSINSGDWSLSLPLAFIPSVDGDFVPTEPKYLLDPNSDDWADMKQLIGSYDLMIGINSGEGGGMVNRGTGLDVTAENFLPNKTFYDEKLIPLHVKSVFGEQANQAMIDAVISEYTDWEDPDNPDSIRQNFCKMHKDSLMLSSVYRTTKAHASAGNRPTYQYYFNLLPYKSIFPRPSWFQKALHGDDLIYIFDNKGQFDVPGVIEFRELQDWEKVASDHIMTLWTNFAKTGNPNKPRDLGVDWLPYTPSRRRYLDMINKVTQSRVRERLDERAAKLWDEFLPAVMEASTCQRQDSDSASGTCSRDGGCPPP